MGKKKKESKKADPKAWLETYGDMITLVLCFFVILMGEPSQDNSRIQLVLASFGGLGPLKGGLTLTEGKLARMGASIESLPSDKKAKALEESVDKAIAMMNPSNSQDVSVQAIPERGLVIVIAGDALFKPNSADVDIERTREMLANIANLFATPAFARSYFRIEGHADKEEDGTPFYSKWEFSAARAANVLHYLVDFGADEKRFQVAGFSDKRPTSVVRDENSEQELKDEDRAASNRRVEIVVLSDGHL